LSRAIQNTLDNFFFNVESSDWGLAIVLAII
jgi:hypothetical protein